MNYREKIEIYKKALENELFVNEVIYAKLKKKAKDFFYLPLILKWNSLVPSFFEKHNLLFKGLLFSTAFLLFFLIPIKNSIDFFKSLFYKNKNLQNVSYLAFANSKVNYDALSVKGNSSRSIAFISTRFVFTDEKKITHIFSCTSLQEKLLAYFTTVIYIFKNSLAFKYKFIFHSHSAFLFFLTLNYLNSKKPTKIITSHHYDRWAVLLDSYANYSTNTFFQIDQHGLLSESFFQQNYSKFNKLNAVSEINAFSVDEIKIFQKCVLARNVQCEFNVRVQENISTVKINNKDNKITILFIGHPTYEILQIELYRQLKNKFDAVFYYKPHPSVSPSSNIKNEAWNIVNFFPDVNYFISYYSTLSISYQSLGVEGYIHSDSMSDYDISSDVEKCIKFFDEKIKERHGQS